MTVMEMDMVAPEYGKRTLKEYSENLNNLLNTDKLFTKIYLINLALLITHEIDSAFWHEWELFHLPGGIQLFLLINLALIFLFLVGAELVIKREKAGKIFSYLLAIIGILTFFIHLYFILNGNTRFLLPVSILILLSIFFTSIAQLIIITHKFKNVVNTMLIKT